MIKTLMKSIREYKRDSILTPVFVTGEVILEVIIPLLMAFLIDKGILQSDINECLFHQFYIRIISHRYINFGSSDFVSVSHINQGAGDNFRVRNNNIGFIRGFQGCRANIDLLNKAFLRVEYNISL